MEFQIDEAIKLLKQTPGTISSLLKDLPEKFITQNEGGDSWSPFKIVGHLIHGEEVDWITRAKFILEHGSSKVFQSSGRLTLLEIVKEKSLAELLELFAKFRKRNLEELKQLDLSSEQLQQKGAHPAFGQVSVKQVLSAWVVHDLNHISQIVRVISKHYDLEVGPFKQCISILNK